MTGVSWQQQPAPTRANAHRGVLRRRRPRLGGRPRRGDPAHHRRRPTAGAGSISRPSTSSRCSPSASTRPATGLRSARSRPSTAPIDGGASWQAARFEPRAAAGGARCARGRARCDARGRGDLAAAPVRRGPAVRSGTLYVAGEAGHLYRSDDAGQSWFELPSPYEGSFFGAAAARRPTAVLAFGLRGHLYRSDDAGRQLAGRSPADTAGAARRRHAARGRHGRHRRARRQSCSSAATAATASSCTSRPTARASMRSRPPARRRRGPGEGGVRRLSSPRSAAEAEHGARPARARVRPHARALRVRLPPCRC